ncbi:MAG: DUF2802 domain-containing protein [Methylococcaceae bacterium]|nr:DUF2802 domain-containing protein [Methylococcaceae bacterium]
MVNFVSGAAGIVAVLFIWLVFERFRFKKAIQLLNEHISENSREVASLKAAAITVERRLSAYEVYLKGMQSKVDEFEQAETVATPYYTVIQKVKAGASAAELIQNFGLNRDEAALLIRLHGQKVSSN